ncbi:glycosyltransferase family 4 protein [Flavivirga sp. Y03]|uniref:Glycosyltransferase family 4 protein n=2 Tax=Flavivirga algicola TaxID=2729136 RepID=A0ABX1RUE3_9FLAO|nr:glycosyltransferase family 4 protein [Flavivirga algicola]
MMQLIDFFKTKNYQITFSSPCAKNDNAFDLTTIGVEQVSIELNHASFDVFIKKLHPDIVLFDRFMMEEQFGWRVAEQCPDALRVLDTEDLHCLRKGRQQAFKEGKTFDTSYLFNDTAKREIASIYRSDLSLIISEVEMEILKNDFRIDSVLLHYLPFMLDEITEGTIEKLPNFDERQHFITIGNFLHEPNYNAVLYLKETIWPLVKKQLPTAELHIYGAYASQKVNQLHNENQGFLVKGFAEDVHDVMQRSRVCLAPIRFGAGLKGKLVDAMQNGTPCMITNVGSEGMFGSMGVNGFIEDTPEKFVEKAMALYTNKNIWEEKQKNGIKVLNERFNIKIHQQNLSLQIEEIIMKLNDHRLKNFTGQMLWHHGLQSTKFMSKWIEEKNK